MRPFVCCRVCCPRHPPTPRFWRSRRLHASGTSPSAIPSGKFMSLNHCNGSNAAKESCRKEKFTSQRKVSVFTFHFNVPLHTSKIFHFAFRSPSRCQSKMFINTVHCQWSCAFECEIFKWAFEAFSLWQLALKKLEKVYCGNDHGRRVEGDGSDLAEKEWTNKNKKSIFPWLPTRHSINFLLLKYFLSTNNEGNAKKLLFN